MSKEKCVICNLTAEQSRGQTSSHMCRYRDRKQDRLADTTKEVQQAKEDEFAWQLAKLSEKAKNEEVKKCIDQIYALYEDYQPKLKAKITAELRSSCVQQAEHLKEDKNKCCRCSLSCSVMMGIMDGGKPICMKCLNVFLEMGKQKALYELKQNPLNGLSDDELKVIISFTPKKTKQHMINKILQNGREKLNEILERRKQLSKESKVDSEE